MTAVPVLKKVETLGERPRIRRATGPAAMARAKFVDAPLWVARKNSPQGAQLRRTHATASIVVQHEAGKGVDRHNARPVLAP